MADVADNLVLESLSSLIGNGDIDSVNIDFKVDKSFLVNGNDMRSGALTIDASEIPFEKTAASEPKSKSIEWWFNNIALLRTTKENDIQTVDCKNVEFKSNVTDVNGAGFKINYPNAPIELTSTKLNLTSTNNLNIGCRGFKIINSDFLNITNGNGIRIENAKGGFNLINSGSFTVDSGEGPINFKGGNFRYTYRTPNASFEKYLNYGGGTLMVSSNDPNADPYFLTKSKLIEDDQTYLINPRIPENGFDNTTNEEIPDAFIQQGINFSGMGSSSLAGLTYLYGSITNLENITTRSYDSLGAVRVQLTLPFNKIFKDGNIDKKLVSNWHGGMSAWSNTADTNCPKISANLGIKYYPSGYDGKESSGDEPIAVTTQCDVWPHEKGGGNQIATSGWVTENFSNRIYVDYLSASTSTGVNVGGTLFKWGGSFGASARMMNEGCMINPHCGPMALQYTYRKNITKGKYIVSFKILTSFSRAHWGDNTAFCARAAMFIKGSKLSDGKTKENEELNAMFFETYTNAQYSTFEKMASKYIYSVSAGFNTDSGENNDERIPTDGLIGKEIRVFDESKEYEFVIIPHRRCPISENWHVQYAFPPILGFLVEMQKIGD